MNFHYVNEFACSDFMLELDQCHVQATEYHNALFRYVKSRNEEQLVGKNPSSSALDDCEPKHKLNNSGIVNPCGLTAWSFFNDSYSAAIIDQVSREVEELDIR